MPPDHATVEYPLLRPCKTTPGTGIARGVDTRVNTSWQVVIALVLVVMVHAGGVALLGAVCVCVLAVCGWPVRTRYRRAHVA
jgi:hypothetical protein